MNLEKTKSSIARLGDSIIVLMSNWFFIFNGCVVGNMTHNGWHGFIATLLFLIIDAVVSVCMLGGISSIMMNSSKLEDNYKTAGCHTAIVLVELGIFILLKLHA